MDIDEAPKAWSIFLSKLIAEYSSGDQVDPLLLKDREVAASIRERISAQINLFDGPQFLGSVDISRYSAFPCHCE